MQFHTILFPSPQSAQTPQAGQPPSLFRDLNLDQIIDAIIAGKREYDLKDIFLRPLRDLDVIEYRHEVMRDLRNPALLQRIRPFATGMQTLRQQLSRAEKLSYKEHKEARFLDAVNIYCDLVGRLTSDLEAADLKSRGLTLFREYLRNYTQSTGFVALKTETGTLKSALSKIQYCLLIKNDRIRVRRYEDERDYTPDVTATFAKFKQGSARDYLLKFSEMSDMNHVEAAILNRVARLHPDVFAELAEYYQRHLTHLDEKIIAFDRDIQFYISFIEYIEPLQQAGLNFCYPRLSKTSKAVRGYEAFDLALAAQNIKDHNIVVCNDFYLRDKERIFVVSGPNQGGKTTFARMFGQLHYMASLGFPVPGRQSRLFSFDYIFTHFEKEERTQSLRGKLEDDLIRIHEVLERATPDSIIIMNETFTATTLKDAIFLGKTILEKIIKLDALCVCVTFIDEFASLAEQTVSMVGAVAPENPALRTYKIVRRRADGLAYAMTIAEKYRLKYDCLMERIQS